MHRLKIRQIVLHGRPFSFVSNFAYDNQALEVLLLNQTASDSQCSLIEQCLEDRLDANWSIVTFNQEVTGRNVDANVEKTTLLNYLSHPQSMLRAELLTSSPRIYNRITNLP